jgi:peptidoglycan hydrolase-like protein with peptidoglycan-binding domain
VRKQISYPLFAAALALAVLLGSLVLAQEGTDSGPAPDGSQVEQGPALSNDDSDPAGEPEVFIPEAYRAVAPADSHNATSFYFTPQDENTSTTVIFLYNTGSVTATVGLQTYRLDGSLYISTTMSVPPAGLLRIAADTVSTVAGSWQDVALVNFTTSSAYGKISAPTGVKAEAYVVWNDASTYDPLQVAPTLPIRFSTDPAAVFLPSVNKN